MRGRATEVVLPAVATLALIAVVAIAATGSTPGGSGESRAPSDRLLDALFTLWILAAVAGGVLLVYGLMQRKAIAQQVSSGRYPRFTLAGFFVFVCLIAVIVRLFGVWHPLGSQNGENDNVFGGPTAAPTIPAQKPSATYEPGISWLVVVTVVVLVVAAVVAYVLSQRRSTVRPDRDEDLAEQLALALDEALDDLRAEMDPRRAIIAAYARMERVLAAGGVPRRSAETPDEYLVRVLRELAPGSDAVARLTSLFTQAKFSDHEVDGTMKEEAIEALEHVRDELRRSIDGRGNDVSGGVATAEAAP
jgi:tetrahydromethanopterin S-methyltransferase subunit B